MSLRLLDWLAGLDRLRESRLPVGPFLVVASEENFYHRLELRLYLND